MLEVDEEEERRDEDVGGDDSGRNYDYVFGWGRIDRDVWKICICSR